MTQPRSNQFHEYWLTKLDVREDGSVYRDGKKARLGTSSTGYSTIYLNKQSTLVHRLVAFKFHGVPPKGKPFVNHKNGIKTDNRAENLEWVSQYENMQHAYDTGILKRKPKGQKRKIYRQIVKKKSETILFLKPRKIPTATLVVATYKEAGYNNKQISELLKCARNYPYKAYKKYIESIKDA